MQVDEAEFYYTPIVSVGDMWVQVVPKQFDTEVECREAIKTTWPTGIRTDAIHGPQVVRVAKVRRR